MWMEVLSHVAALKMETRIGGPGTSLGHASLAEGCSVPLLRQVLG